MRVEMKYGRNDVPMVLDERWQVTVIRKKDMPAIEDPEAAVRQALANPVNARPLAEEARGCRSACILFCDITRPVPNRLFLGEMIRQIMSAGIPAERITLLNATGLHRPNDDAEMAEIIGDPWVLQTVRPINHYARNDDDHVEVGITPRGTPAKIDRRFVEADLRIVTGLVEPHLIAGWSGGRKVIAPGVAHRDTITTFHNFRYVGHPKATNGVLEGNPLHEDQLAIVRLVGGALAVNTVIDEHRRLSFINYGEIVESHLRAVDFCSRFTIVPMRQRFRTIVTSNAGHPLDKTFYQTIKGLLCAMDILEPGGNLIIASECSEGLGSPELVAAQRRLVGMGIDGFLNDIRDKRHADIDEWSAHLLTKPMLAGRVHLYATGLTGEQRELTGAHMIDSLEDAVEASIRETGDHRVAVIPEGPYVLPVYQPAA